MRSVGTEELDLDGLSDGDPNLTKYFREVRKYRLLTETEEQKLGRIVRRAAKFLDNSERKIQVETEVTRIRDLLNGELPPEERRQLEQECQQWCWRLMPFEREEARRRRAINALCQANLRFVVWLTKKLPTYGIPLSDRIQYGNEGLYRAAEKFYPEREIKFVTHAGWWVRQAIMRQSPQHRDSTHIPEYLRQKARQGEADVPHTVSLDAIPDPRRHARSSEAGPEEEVITADSRIKARADLERHFTPLSPRERLIVRAREGLDGSALTLQEISQKLGISRERVRQIHAEAMKKLRRAYGIK